MTKTPTASITKREKAPEFVVGKFGFEFEKLIPFVNDRGYINFDILKNKDGGQYVKVSDYGIEQNAAETEDVPF